MRDRHIGTGDRAHVLKSVLRCRMRTYRIRCVSTDIPLGPTGYRRSTTMMLY